MRPIIPFELEPAPAAMTEERAPAVLRLLARTEFALTPQIAVVVFPGVAQRTVEQTLASLHRRGLVWQVELTGDGPTYLPHDLASRRRRWRSATTLWGLSPQGRNLLAAWGLEDETVVRRVVVRDAAKPELRLGHLRHDLEAVSWVVSAVAEAARNPALRGVRCQIEYVAARDAEGQPLQRFDALLALHFARGAPPVERRPWQIPWVDEDMDGLALRLALEIDRRTERLSVHEAKAQMYRRLTEVGRYRATLGGDVTPVVICPPGRWAKQLVGAWSAGWPDGRGVISTFARTRDAAGHGVLFGEYRTLCERPGRPASLWEPLDIDLAFWQRWCGGVEEGSQH